jgi:hypothetical protein
LTGWTIFLNAAKIDSRVGTGISKPLGVFCFGSGVIAPPSLSQSPCSPSCGLSLIHGEVTVARLNGETNSQRTKYLFRVEEVIEWPKLQWGIAVGDAVHCLRSALDHVVYGLATRPDSNTMFPICRTKKEWVTKAPAMYWSVHPAGVVAMIDEVQPYHDGSVASNHPLALLAALSNRGQGVPDEFLPVRWS